MYPALIVSSGEVVRMLDGMEDKRVSLAGAPPPEMSLHFVCESCRLPDIAGYGAQWEVCHACGGAICEGCTPDSRTRRMLDASGVCRLLLCAPCAKKQDAAMLRLAEAIGAIEDGSWLEDVIAQMEAAIAEAKEAL